MTGLSVLLLPISAWGRAGKMDQPSIAFPTTGEGANGTPDPICTAIEKVLDKHAAAFVAGRFINAHSTMEFGGTTTQLNALLKDLADIAGAKFQVRLAEASESGLRLDGKDAHDDRPYPWRIEHNAWGDAQYLSVTIFLGNGKIKLEDLQIPTIVGQSRLKQRDE
jgi:hypothetical protein